MLAGAFARAGISGPRRDARLLVAEAAGIDSSSLIADPERLLTADMGQRLQAMARRRAAGEPVSRIIGRREFWGLNFEIGPAVLDPRPDTETLVELVLEVAANNSTPDGDLRLLDLGTGSGAIVLAVLSEIKSAQAVGIDCSAQALSVARSNAQRLGLVQRCQFVQADWWRAKHAQEQPLIDRLPFDIVVSNPPYIPTADISELEPEVSRHDPFPALDGGADGLDAYRAIAAGAAARLGPGGWLLLEVGAGQAGSVQHMLQRAGFEAGSGHGHGLAGLRHDLAGIARCIAAQRPVLNSALQPG